VLSRRHELTAIMTRDPRDEALPSVGWVEVEDLETGGRRLVDTSNKKVRERYHAEGRERRRRVEQALRGSRVSLIDVRTDRSYLPVLLRYFSQRRRRSAS
jgi:uncharacterized protein (DUF58 family)